MRTSKNLLIFSLGLLSLALQGCASLPNGKPASDDPLESMNRAIFKFNQSADRVVLKPVAEAYTSTLPEQLRISISNFFGNIGEVGSVANDLLQLKFKQAGRDSGRFLLNTTVGFFGFFDPATEYGIPRNDEDFGQTLGYWGVPAGPYLVLPLLGPSNLRDTAGLVADAQVDPQRQVADTRARTWLLYGGGVVNAIDARARYLGAERTLDSAATDPYLFLKNGYSLRRKSLILDGKIPEEGAVSDKDLFGD